MAFKSPQHLDVVKSGRLEEGMTYQVADVCLNMDTQNLVNMKSMYNKM